MALILSSPAFANNGVIPKRHRYFHKLSALDAVLPDLGHATKAELLDAMKGHVIAETQLVGTYEK